MAYYAVDYSNSLYHHGVNGMKWGVRRYQHEDGTRTSLGKKHEAQLDGGSAQTSRRAIKAQYRSDVKTAKAARKKRIQESASEYGKTLDAIESKYKRGQTISDRDQKLEVEAGNRFDKAIDESNRQYKGDRAKAKADYKKAMSDLKNSPEFKAEKDARRKKIMIGTAVVAGAALAAYGGYKLSQHNFHKHASQGSAYRQKAKNFDTLGNKLDKAGDRHSRNLAWDLATVNNDLADESYKKAKNTFYYRAKAAKNKLKKRG